VTVFGPGADEVEVVEPRLFGSAGPALRAKTLAIRPDGGLYVGVVPSPRTLILPVVGR
jgi:hypothetical protein